MKPSFALTLSHDGISLLHRAKHGWRRIGSAAFDDPALPDTLSYLRGTASGLEPHGIATKLVLPNSQILYTEIDAPGPDLARRRAQIRRALEGRTPYAVDELVFDWCGDGPRVQVAVVARETLAEADAFAAEHRFNPVSFVGTPEPGRFAGEPFFGLSTHLDGILPAGEKLERDDQPIMVIDRSEPANRSGEAGALPAETEPEIVSAAAGTTTEVTGTPNLAMPSASGVPADPATEANSDAAFAAYTLISETPDSTNPTPAPDDGEAQRIAAAKVAADAAADAEALGRFGRRKARQMEARQQESRQQEAGQLQPGDNSGNAAPASATAADVPATGQPATGQPTTAPPDARSTAAEVVPDAPAVFDVPQDDDGAVTGATLPELEPAFATRRASGDAGVAGEARIGALPLRLAIAAAGSDAKPLLPIGGTGPMAAVTAPSVPVNGDGAAVGVQPAANPAPGAGRVADPRQRPAANSKQSSTAKIVAAAAMTRFTPLKTKAGSTRVTAIPRPIPGAPGGGGTNVAPSMTVFGARKSSPVRGKPRYLGLTMLVALLIFLAVVAIWSVFFLGRNDPVVTGTLDSAASPPSQAENTSVAATVTHEALPHAETSPASDPVATDTASPAASGASNDTGAPSDPLATDPANQVASSETAIADAVAASDPLATGAVSQAAPGERAIAGTIAASDLLATDPAGQAASGEIASNDTVATEPAPVDSGAVALTNDAATVAAMVPKTTLPQQIVPAAEPVVIETAAKTPAIVADSPAPSAETAAIGPAPAFPDAAPALTRSTAESTLSTSGSHPLPALVRLAADSRPRTPVPPIPFGISYQRDAAGFVIPTPEGTPTPEGALVFSGPPPLLPPARPEGLAATALAATAAAVTIPAAADPAQTGTELAPTTDPPATALGDPVLVIQSDPALADFRPRPRPANLVTNGGNGALSVPVLAPDFAELRPMARPASVLAAAAAFKAANPVVEDPAIALASASALAVSASRPPAARPKNFSASVNAALVEATAAPVPRPEPQPETLVAAAQPAPPPQPAAEPAKPDPAVVEGDAEPELASAAPAIPTRASVAKQATLTNAINLGKINLIGVYGTASSRRAMVRLGSGRILQVEVGDRVDGGQVAAIGENELRYVKNGRNVVLSLPKDS